MSGRGGLCRGPVPYTLRDDASPAAGGVTVACGLTLSLTETERLMVLRLVGPDGREFHWPLPLAELRKLAEGLVAAADSISEPCPFVPGRG